MCNFGYFFINSSIHFHVSLRRSVCYFYSYLCLWKHSQKHLICHEKWYKYIHINIHNWLQSYLLFTSNILITKLTFIEFQHKRANEIVLAGSIDSEKWSWRSEKWARFRTELWASFNHPSPHKQSKTLSLVSPGILDVFSMQMMVVWHDNKPHSFW